MNSNLVNMHIVLTELEGSMNTLGSRQDELITLVEYTNDYCLFNREEPPEKKKDKYLHSQISSISKKLPNPTKEEDEPMYSFFSPNKSCNHSS